MPNWEFAVGDSVTLAPGATFSQNPNLKRDQVGTISQLGDESDDEEPFEVVNEAGKTWWYELGQLVRASPGSTAKKKKKKRRNGGGPGPSRTPLRKAAGAGKHPAAAVDSLSRLLSEKSSKAEGGAAGPGPAGRGTKPKRTRTPPRKGAAKRSGRTLARPMSLRCATVQF